MYGFLLKRLPASVAQLLMIAWYILLIVLVFRKFNISPAIFRYITL
jgi:uncharacterized integral membrane protein